jgi:hypothetical protein
MCEFLVYLGYGLMGGLMGLVIIKIAEVVFDVDRTRELRRREAEEIAENAAYRDPHSPQSQKLKEEMDQLLSKGRSLRPSKQ